MFEPVFEHPEFAVFNKPAGVSVHSEDGPGFVALVQSQIGSPRQVGDQRQLPDTGKPCENTKWYLVHRLDKDTSGLLILAKTAQAAAQFGELFATHRIEKYYVAIAQGTPLKKQGMVCGDMARSRNGQWKLTRTLENPAVTQFFSTGLGEGRRLYLLRPLTGRTHQLRVALKSLGTPILGDRRYGGASDTVVSSNADRMYLHALALVFRWGDADIRLVVPPADGVVFAGLAEVLAAKGWLEPWQLAWPRMPGKIGYGRAP